MNPSVYLETTIVSYLAANPSHDLVAAAHQRITHDWWENRRSAFRLYVSQLVIEEAEAGDADAAGRRMSYLTGIPVLELREEVLTLAGKLIEQGPIPAKAVADAIHIATAATHGMDYLLTWNLRHIANAEIRGQIERTCRRQGIEPPVLCTPEELLGD